MLVLIEMAEHSIKSSNLCQMPATLADSFHDPSTTTEHVSVTTEPTLLLYNQSCWYYKNVAFT